MRTTIKLPIMVYHSVDRFATSISTAPETFRGHMSWLSRHAWSTIKLSAALSFSRGDAPAPARTVILTFDDGMPSLREEVCPILESYGFCATTFVVTGQVGQKPAWFRLPEAYRDRPLLSVDELGRLREAGWEIQPHTHDHPVLSHLPLQHQIDQIGRSRERVQQWFGSAADVLTYPYGQYNGNTVRAMRECGMAAGLSLRFSARLPIRRPYEWPRIGAAWLKDSSWRQRLALDGYLEGYVHLRQLVRGDRSKHFQQPSDETTQGLLSFR